MTGPGYWTSRDHRVTARHPTRQGKIHYFYPCIFELIFKKECFHCYVSLPEGMAHRAKPNWHNHRNLTQINGQASALQNRRVDLVAGQIRWQLAEHVRQPIDSIDFDRFEYQSSVFRAANGPILTHAIRPLASARYKSRQIFVDLPDGGRRPFCDPKDVVYMMWTSPALALCLLMLN